MTCQHVTDPSLTNGSAMTSGNTDSIVRQVTKSHALVANKQTNTYAISRNIWIHCALLLRVSKVASKLGYVTCQHVKLYYAQMQLGHKSSNTNVTWVISFQIEASLQYNLATDRTLGPADTGQASALVRSWSRKQTFNQYQLRFG